MTFLIEKGGERQRVAALEGYDDWTVLAEGAAARPPSEFHDFVDGRWTLNADRRRLELRRAAAQAMTREELLDRIEALEARLTAAGIP